MIHAVVRARGYRLVGWSVRALDGDPRSSPEEVRARLARRVGAGDVVLLHDTLRGREERAPAGLEALDRILEDLSAKGLRAVTVSELVGSIGRS